jgi:hypothetical protein
MSCCSNFCSVHTGASPRGLPGGEPRSLLLRQLLQIVTHRFAAQRTLDPQGPGERSTAKREVEALGPGVQVRSPAGSPATRIGDGLEAGSSVAGDDSQQFSLGGPLPTTDTGADDVNGHATARYAGSVRDPPRTSLPADRPCTEPAGHTRSLRLPSGRRAPQPDVASAGATGASSERMSIRQPVSRAASRAFCPSLPIANDSW